MDAADRRGRPVIPAVASSFVGRIAELAALDEAVGDHRLVTAVGPGGCGKTRLAAEFAAARSPAVHGFVELAALGPQADLRAAVLAGCGLRDDPARDPADVLHDRLGRADGLLVLDNGEHLREPVAALVADLLRRCPPLRVLVTSRVSIGLTGERVFPLAGLDPVHEGAELLLERARRVQPGLPAEHRIAVEISRLADGLPLAIELAAAHARSLPLTGIRDGMADRMAFLTSRGSGRHGSVAASLHWSAQLVGETARQALAALSVVEGRFPLEVAAAVTGGDVTAVETLVDHSLVQFDAAECRYVLLETVREYAAAMLTEPAVPHARLRAWATGFAAEVRSGLERAEDDVLRRVAHADAAVNTVLDRALDTGDGLAVAAGVAVDLAFGWSLRGRCADGSARVRRLVAALDPAPPSLQWAAAFLAVYSGDLETGFGLAAAAIEQAGDDRRTAARARILTGTVQAFVDPAGAEPVLAEAVVLAREAGDSWGEVEAAQIQSYTYLFRGRIADALACADAVLPALERLGHGQLRAWDAAIRADAAATVGRFADAEEHGRRGFALAVAVGEPVSAAGALVPLLRSLVATGRHDEAAALLDAGLRFLDTHPGLGTDSIAALARAVAAASDDAGAAEVALAAAAGLPSVTVDAALLLATARLHAGDPDGARAAAATAAEAAAALGNPAAAGAAALAGAAADRAGGQDAVAVYDALATVHAHGLRPLVVDGLELAGALARDAGRASAAARLHGGAERLRAELGAAVSPLGELLRPDAAFVAAHAVAVAEGRRLGQAGAVGYAVRRRGRRGRPRYGWDSLTPTEREVAALAAQGRSTAEVGASLLVSTATVRTHLRSVYAKLGVTNRAELAAAAADRDR